MSETGKDKEPWLSKHLPKVLVGIVVFAVLAAAISASVYYVHLGTLPVDGADPAGWGQLGDYFGGLLNPVFSFLTILALALTLILQSRELKLSREELELSRVELRNSAEALRAQNKAIDRQSFEQTFFAWLNTYREILASIEHTDRQRPKTSYSPPIESHTKSKQAMQFLWDARLSNGALHLDFIQADLDALDQAGLAQIAGEAVTNWNDLYLDHEYQLDSLFRVLYRLVVWIDSQDEDRIPPAQKWLYVSIVRAQLSWIELVYLFYNGHTERGKTFKRFAEKYALFDNLNFSTDPVIAIVKESPPDGIGYKPSAYDSKLARVAMGLPESSEQTLAMASDT